MIHFETLKKEELAKFTDQLFAIMAENMSVYVENEAGTEAGKALWAAKAGEALKSRSRNMVLIRSDAELIGFFLYEIREMALTIEDMQIKPEWQGKSNVFWMLFNFIAPELPETLKYIRTKTKKKNAKADGVIRHLGMSVVGETEASYLYEGKFSDFLRWFNRK
ncbi:MAG: hypothetical protein J6S59_04650 [Clostridia bacterium]|nr:hypothetical protein [Clostridia bacterium]